MASGVKTSKMNFELNPRGNLWFNDESTFGHKLLSKMGWSKGKGLGKNEDGIKENIKISKKDANTGVGWKNDVPIAVPCLEYENILQNLQKHFKSNSEKSRTNKRFEKSLEQRSRTARNHLHYQKFVRGKDLIRYSEKDMKSIFLEKPQKPVSEHPSHPPQEAPTFNSQLSVKDYFALKMQKKREEAAKSVTSVKTEEDVSPQTQSTSEKTFSKKRKFVSESPETEITKRTKRTKKDFGVETSSSSIKEDLVVEKSSESEDSSKSKKKKKKRSKKNKSRLQQLKSCLKGRTDYDLDKTRNVSFNEQVSYKILDTSLELCEEINDLFNEEPTLDEAACAVPSTLGSCDEDSENGMLNLYGEDDSVANKDNNPIEDGNCTNEEESGWTSEEQAPQCFDLPKCSGSNFNFWLESQRQASKMKLYKEMVKKIRKDKKLRSTNLLDIKGYGNWGL